MNDDKLDQKLIETMDGEGAAQEAVPVPPSLPPDWLERALLKTRGPLMTKGACLSGDEVYRYLLWRTTGVADVYRPEASVTFVMLNPSTADETIDDPTIRRCMGFAWGWGYTRLIVANLFAYRATKPKELRRLTLNQARGPHNWDALRVAAAASAQVVVAWGGSGGVLGLRAATWTHNFLVGEGHGDKLVHLGLTSEGMPKHPLYLPGAAVRQPWLPKGGAA